MRKWCSVHIIPPILHLLQSYLYLPYMVYCKKQQKSLPHAALDCTRIVPCRAVP